MIDRILQWNVKGLKARQCELSQIMEELNPSCLCLQEIKLSSGNTQYNVNRLYRTYMKTPQNNLNPHGGSMIPVKINILHIKILLKTALQAVAISFPTGILRSLCSVYQPPNDIITEQQLHDLANQLSKPTMIMGGFNAHNPLWYNPRTDGRGRDVQKLIESHNLVTLNEDSPTFYRSYDQATSTIDLALITDTCSNDFTWTIQDELNGSDHYPILVTSLLSTPPDFIE